MPRVQFPLWHGRPCVQILLTLAPNDAPLSRRLVADTGAGSRHSGVEFLLDEEDCLLCGGLPGQSVRLSGAYSGLFPTYDLRVQLPQLGFDKHVRVVGVPSVPAGFDGITCFGFLNRFAYGNFGNPDQFGLEVG